MRVPEKLKGRIVDITPLFEMAGIPGAQVFIVETDGMYPYKPAVEENWSYYTAVGMKHFQTMLQKEGRKPQTIGIIGIGNGIEGIAVARIFEKEMKELIVTDIDEGILEGTLFNLHKTVANKSLTITPVVGSFCEPIAKLGKKVEFVHGNIPNLPAQGSEDLSKGAEKGTFLMVETYEGYNPPKEFLGWALGAQYAFLQSAKQVLVLGGSVITELGGRMPLREVEKLFDVCGFRMEEVTVGFKEQTEALIDFEGYHRLEKEYGTRFEFYRYQEAKETLERAGIENPSFKTTGARVKEMLAPFKVTAGEAVELYHQGIAVGYTVHLFRGIFH